MVVSACFPVIALMRLFNQERPIITTLGNWLLLAFLLLLLWCINRHSIIKSELDLGAANIKWTNDSRMKLRKTKPITHWGCESLLSSPLSSHNKNSCFSTMTENPFEPALPGFSCCCACSGHYLTMRHGGWNAPPPHSSESFLSQKWSLWESVN